jgi:hypothetical protein
MLATRGLGRRLATGLVLATAGLGFGAELFPPDTGIDEPTTVQIVESTSVEIVASTESVVIAAAVDSVELVDEGTEVTASEATDVEIEPVPSTTVAVMASAVASVEVLDDSATTSSILEGVPATVVAADQLEVEVIGEDTSVTRPETQ